MLDQGSIKVWQTLVFLSKGSSCTSANEALAAKNYRCSGSLLYGLWYDLSVLLANNIFSVLVINFAVEYHVYINSMSVVYTRIIPAVHVQCESKILLPRAFLKKIRERLRIFKQNFTCLWYVHMYWCISMNFNMFSNLSELLLFEHLFIAF